MGSNVWKKLKNCQKIKKCLISLERRDFKLDEENI